MPRDFNELDAIELTGAPAIGSQPELQSSFEDRFSRGLASSLPIEVRKIDRGRRKASIHLERGLELVFGAVKVLLFRK